MNSIFRLTALIVVAAIGGGLTAVAIDSTHPQTTTVVRNVTEQGIPVASSSPTTAPTSGISVTDIYRSSGPGVGEVRTDQGLGTGFVIDNQGHVLTNAHVVLNAKTITFQLPGSEGTYDAQLLGLDKTTDVAVLKINAPADKLHPLTLAGPDNKVVVGEPVVAIGNPLGETSTVTSGIVSAVQRKIDSLEQGHNIYGAIQTDAAINHGNSGGPLIDANNQVIGITSQILSDDPNNPESGSIGIGFAIPISTAREVAQQLISTGKVTHTWLGIEGAEVTNDIAKALNLPVTHGVLVGKVVPGGPAAKAGIHGGNTQATVAGQPMVLGGDIIIKIDSTDINTFAQLAETIASHRPGDTVTITVLRDGHQMTINVTLGSQSN